MKRRFTLILLFSTLALAQQKPVQTSDSQAAHIRSIEQNVAAITLGKGEQPRQYSLLELMRALDVPGVSVAVFDDYKILWAKGYGVTEAGSSNLVTTRTLFQAGDISSSLAAAGALALVEQGKLSLDKNVNDELRSWKLPDNEFTKSEKVTLRRILSHTAGLTVDRFTGYAPTDPDAHSEAEPIPTIQQFLDGEKPANTAPVRVEMVPGTKLQYSGGGVTIEQLVLSDRRQALPSSDARSCPQQGPDERKHLRATSAARAHRSCRCGNAPRWHVGHRQAPCLSGDGRAGTLDHAQRSRASRH